MLGVALGAIVLACLLMIIILARYEFKVNAKLAAGNRAVQTRELTLASHQASVVPLQVNS
jgi:hypothetical protein